MGTEKVERRGAKMKSRRKSGEGQGERGGWRGRGMERDRESWGRNLEGRGREGWRGR